MTRTIGVSALALAAVLMGNGVVHAGDEPTTSSFGTTMTLGGTGTVAEAAAEDNELTFHKRRRGYYYGYGPSYYGGYRSYYGGIGYGYSSFSFSTYRPNYYYHSYRPTYYRSSYYYPRSIPYVSYGGYGYGGGFYCGIGGASEDRNAPVMSLVLRVPTNSVAEREQATPLTPTPTPSGTFQYDGGPATPVPLPAPETNPAPRSPAPATGLPVSLPKSKPKSKYTYKAYGQK